MSRFYLMKHWWQRPDSHQYRWFGLTVGFRQLLGWTIQIHVETPFKKEQP